MGLRVRRRQGRGRRQDEGAARRQGGQPRRDVEPGPAGPAGLHDHDRGLLLLLRPRPPLPRGPGAGGRRRGRRDRARAGHEVRRSREPAPGLGALRRPGLDAGHDGHGAQPRPERPHGRGLGGAQRGPPLRLRQLPPLHPDVRRRGPGRGPLLVRGGARGAEAGQGRPLRHRARRGGALTARQALQADRRQGHRQGLPAGPEGPALGCDRRRLRLLGDAARGHLPPPQRHRPRHGHGRERAGDGVRQHGRGLRHGCRLHPQSLDRREGLLRRVPDQRPGRGRGGRHPHAAAADPRHGRGGRLGGAGERAGGVPAADLPRAGRGVRPARGALPRHAGHRVHGPAGPALRPADPQRQAHRRGRAQGRGRHGARGADQRGRGRAARRAGLARPAPPPDARPEGRAQDRHQGAAGLAGCRLRQGRVLGGRGRAARPRPARR